MRGLLYIIFVFPILANAASFSCYKAETDIEKAICSSLELSQLDEQMAYAYFEKLTEFSKVDGSELRDQQRDWLKYRNSTCSAKKDIENCLVDTYKTRISDIKSYVLESKSGTEDSRHYILLGNANLKLCHEMLEVLNDKPVSYYAFPKFIDKKFSQFVPIKMKAVDKDGFFQQMEERWKNKQPVDEHKRNLSLKRWREFKRDFLSDDVNAYITGDIDANHDGISEQFFVYNSHYSNGKGGDFFFTKIENNKLMYDDFSFWGIPFLYKGRFYFFNVVFDVSVDVNEPSLPYRKKTGFEENQAICRYNVSDK